MITPTSLCDIKKLVLEKYNKEPDHFDGIFLTYNNYVISLSYIDDSWFFKNNFTGNSRKYYTSEVIKAFKTIFDKIINNNELEE
jgi:hypothetical protein